MYKALFELAADRAEFVSLLFSRAKPADLPKDATPADLFAAFDAVTPVDADYERNLTRIKERLVETHHLPLSSEELKGIEYVYSSFFRYGPGIGYSSSRSGRVGVGTTYATLMRMTDAAGVMRSFLANEASFEVVKRLEAANLIVPVVGNFSGPKALRAVAAWLRDRNAKVSAYYLSNVEDYLSRDNTWLDFCRNAATLPLAEKSTFIRSGGGYRPSASTVPDVDGNSLRSAQRADLKRRRHDHAGRRPRGHGHHQQLDRYRPHGGQQWHQHRRRPEQQSPRLDRRRPRALRAAQGRRGGRARSGMESA